VPAPIRRVHQTSDSIISRSFFKSLDRFEATRVLSSDRRTRQRERDRDSQTSSGDAQMPDSRDRNPANRNREPARVQPQPSEPLRFHENGLRAIRAPLIAANNGAGLGAFHFRAMETLSTLSRSYLQRLELNFHENARVLGISDVASLRRVETERVRANTKCSFFRPNWQHRKRFTRNIIS